MRFAPLVALLLLAPVLTWALHSGTDVRYLVVFKDTTLKTIRDLTQAHVPLLEQIKKEVLIWLRKHNKETFSMYFHYMPSIFQLHMHVREKKLFHRHIRIQPVDNVVRNLLQDSAHYHKALIITKFCKTIQKSESHKMIGINI